MSSADQGSGAAGRRILAGRYRLDEVIGRGGMSTVYRGTDLALDRVVAVKVALDPLAEENPVYVARFKREARAAAALDHPAVVTIYDAGADGATRFIVMEYVDGRSLSDVLRDQDPAQPLEPARTARIGEQIADALAAAHAAGVIHRDVKPGNVMLTAGDRVKVLDFGIARTADAVTLTQTASVLGTAPYMAPEQAMGQPADARSDIYSLGCVLYEMLTGKPPFMGDVPAAVLHQHVRVPVKPPRELNPSIPPALDQLVVQMLAKQPDDRPQTAAEVRDRLQESERQTAPTTPLAAASPAAPTVDALAGVAAAAAEVPQVATIPQAATVPPEATAATRALPPPAPPPPRRGLWAALAVICLVLLGGAVAYAIAGGSSTSSSTGSHSSPPATESRSSAGSSSSHSTPSTTASTTTTTVTTTPTSTSTTSTPTTSTPTTTVPGPPGQGGTPPGQAKKGKTK